MAKLIVKERGGAHGILNIHGHSFAFCLRGGPDAPGGMAEASLDGCESLARLLSKHNALVKQRLAQSASIDAFLVELQAILDRVVRTDLPPAPPPTDSISRLFDEMQALGWESVVDVDSSIQNVTLRLKDAAGRSHDLSISLPPDYPLTPPLCRLPMPKSFVLRWGGGSTLRDAVEQYSAEIAKYQTVWDILDDFDKSVCILEPEHPKRDEMGRRIAIGNHCSLQLSLDPIQPLLRPPPLRFLGAENVINKLREKAAERYLFWSKDVNLKQNLETMLEIVLPSPETSEKEEFSAECGICYTYRLGTSLPDKVCEKCSRPFHHSCLYDWLHSIPTSRQSFNTIFGSCPYCSHTIQVKVYQQNNT